MNRLAGSLLTICLVFSSPALAASTDLETRLKQQERRIDRLERAVESLQSRLMDTQYGEPAGSGSSGRASDVNTRDPLIGTWECTNNVFTYDISFYDDGLLIQEEPFFSKAKSSRWSRLRENQFVTEQGQTFVTSFRSENELTVTNLTNQSIWECSRK
jgi:hypothetical protein